MRSNIKDLDRPGLVARRVTQATLCLEERPGEHRAGQKSSGVESPRCWKGEGVVGQMPFLQEGLPRVFLGISL
jgi:hypothetical protein